MKTLGILLLLLAAPLPAFAAGAPDMGSALFRMLWALLIVAGLILVIYALLRKRLSLGVGGMRQGEIKVLEIRHLMPKHTLALVEVRGRILLLGVGNGQINLLTRFADTETASRDFDSLLHQ